MKKNLNSILFIIPLFCFSQNSDEIQIYSAILSVQHTTSTDKMVLQQETYSLSGEDLNNLKYKNLKINFKNLDRDAYNDFIVNNKRKSQLINKFDRGLNIVFIGKDEMNSMFKDFNGWNNFYKKYKNANAIHQFSKVGFSKTKTQALLYYSKGSGYLNAFGSYILFEKKNGKWIQTMKEIAWVS